MRPSESPTFFVDVCAVATACAANPTVSDSLGGVCSASSASQAGVVYRPMPTEGRQRRRECTTERICPKQSGIARRGVNRARRARQNTHRAGLTRWPSSSCFPLPHLALGPATPIRPVPPRADSVKPVLVSPGIGVVCAVRSAVWPYGATKEGEFIRRTGGGNAASYLSTNALWVGRSHRRNGGRPAQTATPGCASRRCKPRGLENA